MTDISVDDNTPEFRVVVRHHNRRGPLGPYRLAVAVGFALLIAGNQLLDAASTGRGIDTALLRAALAAWFIWILAGIVSRILAAGRPPRSKSGSRSAVPPAPTSDPDPRNTA